MPAFVNSAFFKAVSVQRMFSMIVFWVIKFRNQGIYAIINSDILIYLICPVRRSFKISISNKHAKRSYYCNIMCNNTELLGMPLQYRLMHWLLFRISHLINAQQSNRDIQALSSDWNCTLSTCRVNRTPWKCHSLVLRDWLHLSLKRLWLNVMLVKMIPCYISLEMLE